MLARHTLSEAAWFRISRAVGRCVGSAQRALAAGVGGGVVLVDDPGFVAGRLLTQMMGSMHLARSGVARGETTRGALQATALDPVQVRDACVRDALAVFHFSPGASS